MNIIEAAEAISVGKDVRRSSDPRRIYTDNKLPKDSGVHLFSLLNRDGSTSPVPLSLEELLADDWEIAKETR